MRHDPTLNLSVSDYSLSAGVFFGGYATMQLPAVHLVERAGARRVLASLLVLWGLLACAQAFIRRPWQLCALRFALGLAEAGYYPGALYHFTRWFPDETLGTATAIFTTVGTCLGLVLGTFLSGAILSAPGLDGLLGLASWRWLFLLQGFPPIALGALVWSCVADEPRDAAWLRADAKALLEARLAAASAAGGECEGLEAGDPSARAAAGVAATSMPRLSGAGAAPSGQTDRAPPASASPLGMLAAARAALARCLTWSCTLYYFAMTTNQYSVVFFLPLLFSEMLPRATPLLITLPVTLPYIVSVVVTVGVNVFAERPPVAAARRRRRLAVVVGCSSARAVLAFLAGLAMLRGAAAGLGASGRRAYDVLALALLGAGYVVGDAPNGSMWALHHEAQPRTIRGASISLVNALGNLGGFVGPYLLGALRRTLGPACPPERPDCVGEWSYGFLLTMALLLLLTAGTNCAFARQFGRRRAGLS